MEEAGEDSKIPTTLRSGSAAKVLEQFKEGVQFCYPAADTYLDPNLVAMQVRAKLKKLRSIKWWTKCGICKDKAKTFGRRLSRIRELE